MHPMRKLVFKCSHKYNFRKKTLPVRSPSRLRVLQMWGLTALLACMGLTCATLGCGSSANEPTPDTQSNAVPQPSNEPAADTQPKRPDGIDWDSWMNERPFRASMRFMWIDCGVIIGNSSWRRTPRRASRGSARRRR